MPPPPYRRPPPVRPCRPVPVPAPAAACALGGHRAGVPSGGATPSSWCTRAGTGHGWRRGLLMTRSQFCLRHISNFIRPPPLPPRGAGRQEPSRGSELRPPAPRNVPSPSHETSARQTFAAGWADKQRWRPRRPSEPVGYALHVRSASSTAGMLASLRAHDRNNCGAALLFPACARKRAAASSHHGCQRNPWPGA